MRLPENTRGAAFALLLLLAVSGCGYSSGYTLPDGVRTIAVPIFRNETMPLRRDIELDVTRAVKRELQYRSDARVVAEAEYADAVLEGIVIDFQQGVLSEGAGDAVQESGISIVARTRLIDARDGRVIAEWSVSDYAAFSNLLGETIDVARDEAVRELARRIVVAIEPWKVPPGS